MACNITSVFYAHLSTFNSFCLLFHIISYFFINSSLQKRSDYCTVDGAGIVLYKVTKFWRKKAFKSVVMVGLGQGKRPEGLRVSIRVKGIITQKFHLLSHITNLYSSAIT